MANSVSVTSADVLDALRSRWPDSEYLTIREAPDGAARLGRKLDALVISLWRSRGYELDGIEIKVSHSDWMREVNNPAKADFWWRHTHRFWVAVPVAIAAKVRETLPSTWGLLAVQDGKCKEVVKAPKHQPEPLSWENCIGLMRAACDAGPGALLRAQQSGERLGYERAKAQIERTSVDGRLQQSLDDLTAKVEAFAAASGIDISGCWSPENAAQLGGLVTLVQKHMRDPGAEARNLRTLAKHVTDAGQKLASLVEDLEASTRLDRGAQPLELEA
jgi:hypothetical protein